jgi:Tfp pilus assembly protein PilE
MVVVAIVGILASIAGISYTVFSDKAKTVEAETALVEVNRLEMMYYEARGHYSSDLQAIGYTATPALKSYTVEVEVASGIPGVGYRATAKPKGNLQLEPWILTRYENGNTVLEKLTSTVTAESTLGGGSGDSSGSAGGSSDSSGVSASGKGSTSKGPGTVIQTINGSSSTGGSMGPGGNQPTIPVRLFQTVANKVPRRLPTLLSRLCFHFPSVNAIAAAV